MHLLRDVVHVGVVREGENGAGVVVDAFLPLGNEHEFGRAHARVEVVVLGDEQRQRVESKLALFSELLRLGARDDGRRENADDRLTGC